MKISSAVAIASFGHDSSRPKRKASVVCLCLLVMSLLLGVVATVQVRQASILRSWPHPHDMLFILTFCLQIVILTCLISSRGILNTEATMVRLLHLLPLTEFKRWLLVHMPQLLLLTLIVIASIPALQACISMVGLHFLWLLVIVGCASLSAVGLCYGLPYKSILHFSMSILCVSLEAWLLRLIMDVTTSPSVKILYYSLFTLLIAVPMLSLLFANRVQPHAKQHYSTVHFPGQLWYVTKIVRSYTGRTSFLFTVLYMALVTAGSIYLHVESVSFLCTASGLILASFCSDIRSLANVKQPPEIIALRGTWYFIRKQTSSICIGLLAATPVIAYLVAIHVDPQNLAIGLLMMPVGAAAGLLAATIVGAKSRDVSSQCAAVLISCVLFYVCSRLTAFFSNSVISALITVCIFAVMLALTFGIEYKRNTYIWRKNHDRT